MVKTRSLIKNELIKLFNRKVVIALYVVLAVITLLSASAAAIDDIFDFSYSLTEEAEIYEDWAEGISTEWENSISNRFFSRYLKDGTYSAEELAELQKAECLLWARLYREASDNGIETSADWRFENYRYAMENEAHFIVLRDALKDGKYTQTVSAILKAYNYTTDDVYAGASNIENTLNELKALKFSDYIEPLYTEARQQYDSILAYTPSDDDEKYIKLNYEIEKTAAKARYDFYAYIYENELKQGSPECTLALNGVYNAQDLENHKYVSEKEYELNEYMHYDYSSLIGSTKEMSYEQYLERNKRDIEPVTDRIAVTYRCIETGRYDIASGGHSRTATFGFFGNGFMFLIFATVIFSTVLSNEYATKTIHMLVIRPASRSKILVSKYLAAGITSMILYWAAALTHFLISGAITGFDDITQSVYFKIFGNLVEVPYLLHYLLTLIVCSLGILMLSMFAFVLTTTAKSGTAGIVLTMIVSVMAPVIATIFAALLGTPWYTYNPLAYATVYSVVDCGILTGDNYSLIGLITGSETAGADIIFGTVVIIAFIVLFTALAHLRFNRKDIK